MKNSKTPEIYIFDTSVLIAFSNLQKLDLLCRLYKKIYITEAVRVEFSDELPTCVGIKSVKHASIEIFQSRMNIGLGEASVIVYSLNSKKNITCFIDDQRARKIAKRHSLKVSGTIGILMKMEEKGLIPSAYEEVLQINEQGFYVSEEILENLKMFSIKQK